MWALVLNLWTKLGSIKADNNFLIKTLIILFLAYAGVSTFNSYSQDKKLSENQATIERLLEENQRYVVQIKELQQQHYDVSLQLYQNQQAGNEYLKNERQKLEEYLSKQFEVRNLLADNPCGKTTLPATVISLLHNSSTSGQSDTRKP